MDLQETVLLGTLMVVGLRVTVCLVKESLLPSTLFTGLTGMGSEYRDMYMCIYVTLSEVLTIAGNTNTHGCGYIKQLKNDLIILLID